MPVRRALILCLAAAVALLTAAPVARANLILNGGFEEGSVPPGFQGELPAPYFNFSADLYSNDGSAGLSLETSGNFPGKTAFEGNRFAAGAQFSDGSSEAFGQELAALLPGLTYTFSAYLLESARFGISGGYELFLSPSADIGDPNKVSLGSLAPTTGSGDWEFRSLSFTAPLDAANQSFLVLSPYSSQPGLTAYIGIDAMSLTLATAVPEPSSLALGGIGMLAGLCGAWRRRKRLA